MSVDKEKTATDIIAENYHLNNLDTIDQLGSLIIQQDLNTYLLTQPNTFDIIDIDPFGSCVPYLKTALEQVRDNGLILVTATDLKVLEG